MDSCDVGSDLLELRRDLAWRGLQLGDYFHASEDKQEVRDAVFATILKHDFTVQATIMEKSKAQPQVKADKPRFYQYGWFYHFNHGMRGPLADPCEALITTACLGTKKERLSFETPVNRVMKQVLKPDAWRTDFRPNQAEPCLQVVDYCAWAIQRWWERDDARSYDLISDRITYEYDLWSHGNHHYY